MHKDGYHGLELCGTHLRMVRRFIAEVGNIEDGIQLFHHRNDESRRKAQARLGTVPNVQRENLNAGIIDDAIARRIQDIQNVIDHAMREEPVPRGELERITQDSQNVHTPLIVKQTKNVVERVLKIEVPQKYKWVNKKTLTLGEIIVNCGLGPKTVELMTQKYRAKDNIYELGDGVYGRVLDAVWQFIKSSEHKEDLCKILRQELRDNIGKCQAGNLTRLCNVLSGYMDGVVVTESPAEILGREFPKLWDIDDEDERVEAGNKILKRLGITNPKMCEEWIASLY